MHRWFNQGVRRDESTGRDASSSLAIGRRADTCHSRDCPMLCWLILSLWFGGCITSTDSSSPSHSRVRLTAIDWTTSMILSVLIDHCAARAYPWCAGT